MISPLIPLSCRSFDTVVPFFLAIEERVSPLFTATFRVCCLRLRVERVERDDLRALLERTLLVVLAGVISMGVASMSSVIKRRVPEAKALLGDVP